MSDIKKNQNKKLTYYFSKACGFILHTVVHTTAHFFAVAIDSTLCGAAIAFESISGGDELMIRRGNTILIESRYDAERRSGRMYMKGQENVEKVHVDKTVVADEVSTLDAFGFEYCRDGIRRELGFSDECYDGPVYNGHLQTLLAGGITRPPRGSKVMQYERQTVKSPFDSCSLCLDWRYSNVVKRHASDDTNHKLPNPKGLIVIFPGLSSHSHSNYIERYVLHANTEGYHIVVVNARGMGTAPLDTPLFACGSFIEDIKGVLSEYINDDTVEERFGKFPRRVAGGVDGKQVVIQDAPLPILGVGFSLGASMLSLYLSEVRENTSLHAAIAICAPWNFHDSTIAMSQPFAMSVYQPSLLKGLHNTFEKHYKMLLQHPDEEVRYAVQMLVDGYKCKSVREFDIRYTVPIYKYSNVEAYYSDASSFPRLHKVEIPLLCLAAEDDPITGPPPVFQRWTLLCNANPNLLYVSFPTGGHLGFTQGPINELLEGANYMERRTVRALDTVCGYVYNKHRRESVPEILEERHY